MPMQILGSFAEFERAMISERANGGLETAGKQGRIGGRKSKYRLNKARRLFQEWALEFGPGQQLHDSLSSILLQLHNWSPEIGITIQHKLIEDKMLNRKTQSMSF
tara:strand:+ start:1128 stop:1442 length:315 start_codon:yes stop_codon:yes gene_type:complete